MALHLVIDRYLNVLLAHLFSPISIWFDGFLDTSNLVIFFCLLFFIPSQCANVYESPRRDAHQDRRRPRWGIQPPCSFRLKAPQSFLFFVFFILLSIKPNFLFLLLFSSRTVIYYLFMKNLLSFFTHLLNKREKIAGCCCCCRRPHLS